MDPVMLPSTKRHCYSKTRQLKLIVWLQFQFKRLCRVDHWHLRFLHESCKLCCNAVGYCSQSWMECSFRRTSAAQTSPQSMTNPSSSNQLPCRRLMPAALATTMERPLLTQSSARSRLCRRRARSLMAQTSRSRELLRSVSYGSERAK